MCVRVCVSVSAAWPARVCAQFVGSHLTSTPARNPVFQGDGMGRGGLARGPSLSDARRVVQAVRQAVRQADRQGSALAGQLGARASGGVTARLHDWVLLCCVRAECVRTCTHRVFPLRSCAEREGLCLAGPGWAACLPLSLSRPATRPCLASPFSSESGSGLPPSGRRDAHIPHTRARAPDGVEQHFTHKWAARTASVAVVWSVASREGGGKGGPSFVFPPSHATLQTCRQGGARA